MTVVDLERHPQGPRLRFFGQRSHHGAWGAMLTLLGVATMVHDWKDRRDWFRKGWQ